MVRLCFIVLPGQNNHVFSIRRETELKICRKHRNFFFFFAFCDFVLYLWQFNLQRRNHINKSSGIEIPESWLPTMKKHKNRKAVRQQTAEGRSHRNCKDRDSPITAVENQPIRAAIEDRRSQSTLPSDDDLQYAIEMSPFTSQPTTLWVKR